MPPPGVIGLIPPCIRPADDPILTGGTGLTALAGRPLWPPREPRLAGVRIGPKHDDTYKPGNRLWRRSRGPPEADGAAGVSLRFDFERLVELCRRTHDETRRSAARAVDRSLVVRNWLFGWYIVEYEQSGADRAEYGTQTLKKLSAALKERIGRGFSVDILEQTRRFYRSYEHIVADASSSVPISETLSRISSGFSPGPAPSFTQLAELFPLGWSPSSRRPI